MKCDDVLRVVGDPGAGMGKFRAPAGPELHARAPRVAFARTRAYHPAMPSSRAPQTYEGKAVTVTYDSRLCIHSEECVRALPGVFDPARRRWIRPDAADPDQVVAAVARCPTGALRARGLEDAPAVAPPHEVVVTVSADGPLLLRGPIRIVNAAGETIAWADAAAHSRCGGTGNPPFCDGSHVRIGFTRS